MHIWRKNYENVHVHASLLRFFHHSHILHEFLSVLVEFLSLGSTDLYAALGSLRDETSYSPLSLTLTRSPLLCDADLSEGSLGAALLLSIASESLLPSVS